jgi:hypothetical protein
MTGRDAGAAGLGLGVGLGVPAWPGVTGSNWIGQGNRVGMQERAPGVTWPGLGVTREGRDLSCSPGDTLPR